MRLFKFAVLYSVLLIMQSTQTFAKTVLTPKIYAFGFAASFNDSTVYFTDIQEIDNVWIDSKTKFLVNRDDYSYQLRDYLAQNGEPNRTCIIVYSESRVKVEKKYVKMKKKYSIGKKKENSKFEIKYIESNNFKFKAVMPDEIVDTEK